MLVICFEPNNEQEEKAAEFRALLCLAGSI